MKSWVRWTLLVQILFFSAWVGYEEWIKASGQVVLLETLPVDPRDLISGQYLQLKYKIAQVEQLLGFPKPEPGRAAQIGVLLKAGGQVNVGGIEYTLWQAVRCQVPPPSDLKTGEGVWVVGEWFYNNAVTFGIEKYYFSEKRKSELANLRSGKIYVRALAGKGGKLAIQGLVF